MLCGPLVIKIEILQLEYHQEALECQFRHPYLLRPCQMVKEFLSGFKCGSTYIGLHLQMRYIPIFPQNAIYIRVRTSKRLFILSGD